MKKSSNDDGELGLMSFKRVSVNRNWVIYPENKIMRYWDALMLCLIFVYAFTVPYQLGVSGGRHLLQSVGWFVITVCMNSCFFVDTFLHFFRAYRDTEGRMVIDPRTIRKNYLWGLFLPNLLSNLPTTILFYWYGHKYLLDENDELLEESYVENTSSLLILLKSSDVLKLLRLGRASKLMATSDYVRDFREQQKAYTVRMWVFVFLIVMAAHWFACTWSLVAFIQAGGFGPLQAESNGNWIKLWYNSNYEEGGLNPIGWDNDTDRYVLSLFWAIQTITSIGYGNIAPFSPVEWWVASVLQLLAGFLWAYIIGGLVGVVTAMEVKKELFRARIDNANELVSIFLPEEKARGKARRRADPDYAKKEIVAKRIRRYIYTQNERPRSNFRCISSLDEAFPVLNSLSPELRRASCLIILQTFLERVPYLSSRFLSSAEQALVAERCFILELPAGECFNMADGIDGCGRGILVQRSGLAVRTSSIVRLMPILSGGVFGDGEVLLEDDHPGTEGVLHVLSFSTMMLIPREAVLSALARNSSARKCSRWKYFGACIAEKAAAQRREENEKGIADGRIGSLRKLNAYPKC